MGHISKTIQNGDNISRSSEEIQTGDLAFCKPPKYDGSHAKSADKMPDSSCTEELSTPATLLEGTRTTSSMHIASKDPVDEARKDNTSASTSGSPWYQLRKDATTFVSQTLQRGRKNLWQLTTSRVSVLLSSSAVSSASIHQFLKNYEDLNVFILAGEAFCGVEAVEFRQKLKVVCENYFAAFHRQSIYVSALLLSI